jgi:UDP-2-acetamido-2,6-beta-L-arabino-hexul-4-ose reductase
MEIKRYPLEKHEDPRGILVQNEYGFVSQNMKHFLVSFSKPGIIRGNHYHERKREWFYVIQGKMKLYVMDLKTKEKDEIIIDSNSPELVEMEPSIVHTIENIGQDDLIFLGIVNEAFDPKNPDTFSYQLK